MKLLVLDTRWGDSFAHLFVVDLASHKRKRLRLGYVPELFVDQASGELLVVETVLGSRIRPTRHWLKSYRLSDWKLVLEQATPQRPMYTGFPGRSTRVCASPSGRYLYLLESRTILRMLEDGSPDGVFRLTAHRYDRTSKALEAGLFTVESCTVAFGHAGDDDDRLYFHLSCEYPSTVVFASFSSPELEWIKMDETPPRDHSPRETIGSWFDSRRRALYCVNGEGAIHRVTQHPGSSQQVCKIPLEGQQSIPLQQIYGDGDWLYVGVSADINERSLGLGSLVWKVNIAESKPARILNWPFPVLNYVADPSGELLAGVSPYEKAACLMETSSGSVRTRVDGVGVSPGEVFLVA